MRPRQLQRPVDGRLYSSELHFLSLSIVVAGHENRESLLLLSRLVSCPVNQLKLPFGNSTGRPSCFCWLAIDVAVVGGVAAFACRRLVAAAAALRLAVARGPEVASAGSARRRSLVDGVIVAVDVVVEAQWANLERRMEQTHGSWPPGASARHKWRPRRRRCPSLSPALVT